MSPTFSLPTGYLLNERKEPDDLWYKCLALNYVKIIIIHLIYVSNMATTQISHFFY